MYDRNTLTHICVSFAKLYTSVIADCPYFIIENNCIIELLNDLCLYFK